MGFSVPLTRWFRSTLRRLFEELVLDRGAFTASLFDPSAVEGWWRQHQRGVRDFGPHLWALLALEAWGRRFLR
jgi:asparagine synthase (glutamine-hydrolysing)